MICIFLSGFNFNWVAAIGSIATIAGVIVSLCIIAITTWKKTSKERHSDKERCCVCYCETAISDISIIAC